MLATDFMHERLKDQNLKQDFDTLLKEYEVLELRVTTEEEVGSRREPITLIVDLREGRTLIDLLSLEGELEVLFGHRLKLLTKNGLLANRLNEIFEKSQAIYAAA